MFAVTSFSKTNNKKLDKVTKNMTRDEAIKMVKRLTNKGIFCGAYEQNQYVTIATNYTADRVGTNKRINPNWERDSNAKTISSF